jgi:hypothetical protein
MDDRLIKFLQDPEVRGHLAKRNLAEVYKMVYQWELPGLTDFFLKDLNIDPLNYLTTIPPYYYFSNNHTYDSIVIPKTVTDIEYRAFSGCTSLQTVKFEFRDGEDLVFSPLCFDRCNGLQKFVFPEGTLSIGNRSFDHCSNLTEIVLPKTLQKIDEDAFYYSSQRHKKDFLIKYCGTMKDFGQIDLRGFWIAQPLDIHCSDGVLNDYLY